ncbi:Replication protein RepA [Escherichia coli]
MPAFEWVHVQLHQQKGMISLSPPTICNSALVGAVMYMMTKNVKFLAGFAIISVFIAVGMAVVGL